jgi:hypothetical protein
MTTYSDLETGDSRISTSEKHSLTHNKKTNESQKCCKIEYCWWCLLLLPIGIAVSMCIYLSIFIYGEIGKKNKLNDTNDYNNTWIILASIGLVFCGCPLIYQSIQLCIGYICSPKESSK